MTRFYRILLHSLLITLAITIFANDSIAYSPPKPWSTWYQIKDDALNGIWFSWKCSEGNCEWRWDNRYSTEVKIRFSLRHVDSAGSQKIANGEQRLATGQTESAAFTITAKELKGVDIEILEPKYTGPRSTKYVPSSTAEVDAENKRLEVERLAANKRREAERLAEYKRKEAEKQAEAQRALEEQQEQYRREQLAEERREALREQREEAQQQQREEDRRHEASEQRRYNEQLRKDRQSATSTYTGRDSISEALQNQTQKIREQNRQREEQLRKENEAREARRQAEEAEKQRRQAEENRRLQQQRDQERRDREQKLASERKAQEQKDKDERERIARENEKKALATRLAKEKSDREKLEKELKTKKELTAKTSNQTTQGSSGSYATDIDYKNRGKQPQQQQQPQPAKSPEPPPPQQQPQQESCPPSVWDEHNNDRTQFTVYVRNTCEKLRLEVSSIDYYDSKNVLCNTMLMPDTFVAGSKVIPLDCRRFEPNAEWKFPTYKVNYRFLN